MSRGNRSITFCQVPDSDEDHVGTVLVGGKSVRAASLALDQSISQITGAARPALGCKVSPRLAQRGCELVVTLVREVSLGGGIDRMFCDILGLCYYFCDIIGLLGYFL